jgi:hypothetical protein
MSARFPGMKERRAVIDRRKRAYTSAIFTKIRAERPLSRNLDFTSLRVDAFVFLISLLGKVSEKFTVANSVPPEFLKVINSLRAVRYLLSLGVVPRRKTI